MRTIPIPDSTKDIKELSNQWTKSRGLSAHVCLVCSLRMWYNKVELPTYSYLNASTGRIRVARQAG